MIVTNAECCDISKFTSLLGVDCEQSLNPKLLNSFIPQCQFTCSGCFANQELYLYEKQSLDLATVSLVQFIDLEMGKLVTKKSA
jgi:hypothetical protein